MGRVYRLFGFLFMMPGQDPVLVGERLEDLPVYLKVFPGKRCNLRHDFCLFEDQRLDLTGLGRSGVTLREVHLPLLCKFAPAFPNLADAVEAFFCIREHPEVLFVKFTAVPAPEDEIDLGFLDYLVFSGWGFLHNNTVTKLTMREKRIVVHPAFFSLLFSGGSEIDMLFHAHPPEPLVKQPKGDSRPEIPVENPGPRAGISARGQLLQAPGSLREKLRFIFTLRPCLPKTESTVLSCMVVVDPLVYGILGLAAGFFLGWLAVRVQITAIEKRYRAELERWKVESAAEIRKDSVNRSRSTLKGKIAEQMAPLLPSFGYLPADARFIGSPVDYIIFDGLSAVADEKGSAIRIVFMDVKQGSATLTRTQRIIKKAVEEHSVAWETFHVGDP